MRIELISEGFPGKMINGYMGWSSIIFVEHQGKQILFDAGGIDKRVDLCPQIIAAGGDPRKIDYLVISHFHLDHIYNYDHFPNAEILMYTDEIAYAREGKDPWQPHHMLESIEKSNRLRSVVEGEMFMPGISFIHLPGHTPGCMGLVLEDPSVPTTVLAGDAIKTIVEMATGKAPMTVAPEATFNSVKRVKEIAERVIPGHDRVLRIEKDRVVALNAARRTIIVPENVVDIGTPRYLELTLEPTSLPYSNGL
jgi:glyoxylase-like metal-dependent hydrolase (beta-lactamase superfamily II)